MDTIGHFINGQHAGAVPGGRFAATFNPATGEQIGQVLLGTVDQVGLAVKAAAAALPAWAATPAPARARVMFRFKDLLERNMDRLAAAITREHGKTIEDAKGELIRGIEVVEFACGIPHLLKGEFSDQVGRGVDTFSMRHPVGVCVGITPFNFPAMVPLWMFPVALACGNSFILKPSEKDPSLALRMA